MATKFRVRATHPINMSTIEIPLLNYIFHFKRLTWREEFAIKYEPKRNRMRTLLAHALLNVSGITVATVEEAWKVIAPIPDPILSRVFIIYKGSLSEAKMFTTLGLYRAPEPNRFARHFEKAEQEREKVMDKVEQEMESKFGRKEVEEALEVERQMAKNSKLRGVTPASPDRGRNGG